MLGGQALLTGTARRLRAKLFEIARVPVIFPNRAAKSGVRTRSIETGVGGFGVCLIRCTKMPAVASRREPWRVFASTLRLAFCDHCAYKETPSRVLSRDRIHVPYRTSRAVQFEPFRRTGPWLPGRSPTVAPRKRRADTAETAFRNRLQPHCFSALQLTGGTPHARSGHALDCCHQWLSFKKFDNVTDIDPRHGQPRFLSRQSKSHLPLGNATRSGRRE
jgi:hypothetical protein